ncbi:MAG: hypothetical protein J6C51_07275 [Clostridia bacterium]|nr:hypothetical protein [Clostridia bacterium]
MSILKKYWALLLAVILLAASVLFYYNVYSLEKTAHESKVSQLETMISAVKDSIQLNSKYTEVQEFLEEKTNEFEVSRMELYSHFPKEMKEEDQIMYVLYLETLFDTEIEFAFGAPVDIQPLSGGYTLQGLDLTVNYETTYDGYQDMVEYLSTDSRITSVVESTMEYDAETDTAIGLLKLRLYLINSEDREYLSPDVAIPETGKDNIFD